jgi:hypothetical protein
VGLELAAEIARGPGYQDGFALSHGFSDLNVRVFQSAYGK